MQCFMYVLLCVLCNTRSCLDFFSRTALAPEFHHAFPNVSFVLGSLLKNTKHLMLASCPSALQHSKAFIQNFKDRRLHDLLEVRHIAKTLAIFRCYIIGDLVRCKYWAPLCFTKGWSKIMKCMHAYATRL